mgnify:CR=1 FL=1
MKKIVISFTVVIFFLMILSGMFLVKRYRIDLNQEYIDDHLLLRHGSVLTQKFKARHNNLSTIKTLEATNPIINNKAANQEPLRFVLKEEQTGLVVRSLDFSGANVGEQEKLQMSFVSIADSKNKVYLLSIESLSSPSAKLVPEIKFSFSRKAELDGGYGMISLAEPWIKGNLAVRTYYKDRLLFLSCDSMIDFFNRLQSDREFVVFYLVVILSLFILAILIG